MEVDKPVELPKPEPEPVSWSCHYETYNCYNCLSFYWPPVSFFSRWESKLPVRGLFLPFPTLRILDLLGSMISESVSHHFTEGHLESSSKATLGITPLSWALSARYLWPFLVKFLTTLLFPGVNISTKGSDGWRFRLRHLLLYPLYSQRQHQSFRHGKDQLYRSTIKIDISENAQDKFEFHISWLSNGLSEKLHM